MSDRPLRRYVWSTKPNLTGRRNIHISAGFNHHGRPIIGPGCPNVALSGPWDSCDAPWNTPDDARLCVHCFAKRERMDEWDDRCHLETERMASNCHGGDA